MKTASRLREIFETGKLGFEGLNQGLMLHLLHICNKCSNVLGRGDQNTPGCTTQQAELPQKALSST